MATKRTPIGRQRRSPVTAECVALYRKCCELKDLDEVEFNTTFWALHRTLGHHPWSMLPILHDPADVTDDGWPAALDEALAELPRTAPRVAS